MGAGDGLKWGKLDGLCSYQVSARLSLQVYAVV